MSDTNRRKRYSIETVAQFVEWLVENISSRPDRSPNLSDEQRDQWARYPAQVRAHRYPFVFIDPDLPLAQYLASGQIGPAATAMWK